MGLFDLFSDIDSYNKLQKKYGFGVADEFLKNRKLVKFEDRRHQEEVMMLRKQQMDYDNKKAVADAVEELKYDMNNQLRKNDIPLTDYELNKIHGLIKQTDYIYNQKSMDEICFEWNDFWYSKELIYYVSIRIKEIQRKLGFISNTKTRFNEEKVLNMHFDKIYNSNSATTFLNNIDQLFDYLKSNYDIELIKENISIILDEIKKVKKDWKKEK